MKIVANIQPFTITQTFQVVNEYSNTVEAEFFTTLNQLEEDITAQADRYNVHEIYLHGNEGYLDKIQKDIERANMNKYNNAVSVYIV